MSVSRGPSFLGRSPMTIGVIVLAVLAVIAVVSDRSGGEAGAAYGADDGADCHVLYPAGLDEVDFAFDGVVTGTGPSVSDRAGSVLGYTGVTFEVREWFAGGPVPEVTVDLSTRPSPGTRLLVSGAARWGGDALDAPVSWQACGFVRSFSPAVADEWRTTLTP